jgi:hypothetical protein
MKIFIQRMLFFLLLFMVSFSLLVVLNYFLVNSEQMTTIKNRNILLLGDSNMQCAINDSIFKSAINLAASADSYFYSYLKLKRMVNSNSDIDTVLLSFSPHNLFENGWLLNDENIYSKIQTYYTIMDWDDFVFLFYRNPRAVVSSSSPIIKRTLLNTIKKITNAKINAPLGGFLNLNRNILHEVQIKLKNGEPLPFFKIPNSFIVSTEEEEYLNKIISLCRIYKIKLYLINLPKRIELLQYPKYGVNTFNKLYDSKYRDIDFIDCSNLELPDDNYGDFVHLNSKGSSQFSSLLQIKGLKCINERYNRNKAHGGNFSYPQAGF